MFPRFQGEGSTSTLGEAWMGNELGFSLMSWGQDENDHLDSYGKLKPGYWGLVICTAKGKVKLPVKD